MFYCDDCGKKKGWATDALLRSKGLCEVCGTKAVCNDMSCKELPPLSPQQVLETVWDMYEQAVDDLAADVFNREIQPFCVKRGWKFLAGMGTWWVGPTTENAHRWVHESYTCKDDAPEDEEWQRIAALLETEIPGMPANDLGSVMPEYDPG